MFNKYNRSKIKFFRCQKPKGIILCKKSENNSEKTKGSDKKGNSFKI